MERAEEGATKRTDVIVLNDTSPLYTRLGLSNALDALQEMNALVKYREYGEAADINDLLVCCTSDTGTKIMRHTKGHTLMMPYQKDDMKGIEMGIEWLLDQYDSESKIPLVVSDSAYMENIAELLKKRNHAVTIII